jgi:ankyrin repeat protein
MITVDEGKIDANGWNKLHHACSGGRLEEVQSILTKRGSVLSKQHTNVGYLPIHLAI